MAGTSLFTSARRLLALGAVGMILASMAVQPTEAHVTTKVRHLWNKHLKSKVLAQLTWANLKGIPAGFADGTDSDTTYSAGNGLMLTGAQFAANTNVLQARVAATCAAGSSIRSIDAAGGVVCEADDSSTGAWLLGGNSGTTPGTNFLGTTDNQPLELKVNGLRALRLEPNATSPNVVGGFSGNITTAGVVGAAIGGGGASGFTNRVTDAYGTVAGGRGNRAGDADGTASDQSGATVAGGESNTASSYWASVGGGFSNTAGGSSATVGGGFSNVANGAGASVGGGSSNTAVGENASVGGGEANIAGTRSTVGGGFSNTTSGGLEATVGGGRLNTASDDQATVGGGYSNTASGVRTTVGGGISNTASGLRATVAGGESNLASGFQATVGGGGLNTASGWGATVGGGYSNTASGLPNTFATVGGGRQNTANGLVATVGGGFANTAGGSGATVGGGEGNIADGSDAAVGGGHSNTAGGDDATVGGGFSNTASGLEATIPGGRSNTAAGDNSFAAGRRATIGAAHDGSFLFADQREFDFNSAAANEFAVRATGGARFVLGIDPSGSPTWTCSVASGGSWSCSSDRNLKENLAAVDGREVLRRLEQIPIMAWSAKDGDPNVRHLGPMAQDFHAAFGLGDDDTHLATIDLDGVALAAIQGLNRMVEEKDQRITALEDAVGGLESAGSRSAARSSLLLFGAVGAIFALALGLGLGLGLGLARKRVTAA